MKNNVSIFKNKTYILRYLKKNEGCVICITKQQMYQRFLFILQQKQKRGYGIKEPPKIL